MSAEVYATNHEGQVGRQAWQVWQDRVSLVMDVSIFDYIFDYIFALLGLF